MPRTWLRYMECRAPYPGCPAGVPMIPDLARARTRPCRIYAQSASLGCRQVDVGKLVGKWMDGRSTVSCQGEAQANSSCAAVAPALKPFELRLIYRERKARLDGVCDVLNGFCAEKVSVMTIHILGVQAAGDNSLPARQKIHARRTLRCEQ